MVVKVFSTQAISHETSDLHFTPQVRILEAKVAALSTNTAMSTGLKHAPPVVNITVAEGSEHPTVLQAVSCNT